MDDSIYLDYAAATPLDGRVHEVMQPYFTEKFFNPSSVYLHSRGIKQDIADARATIAHWLGSRPSEIIFTAGATEANNLAIDGVMKQHPDAHMVTTSVEHEAVLMPADGYNSTLVSVDDKGAVSLDSLEQAITGTTVLVSVIYANNEIGTVQHMADISSRIAKIKKQRSETGNSLPLLLHTDASQAANYLDLHVSKLGVDLMTLNSGKTYGPKQVGALYVRAGVALSPSIVGGGQEKNMRSGTENVAGIIGFAKALDIAQKSRKDEVYRLSKIRTEFINSILQEIEEVEVLGHRKNTLPNIISLLIPGVDGERLVMMLDEKGFQCATGSACSALSDESSHVIRALGRSEQEARSTLRISMGRPTSEADMVRLADVLPGLVRATQKFA